jgi:pimeloyl-ACP methyl ester carboxylesterase
MISNHSLFQYRLNSEEYVQPKFRFHLVSKTVSDITILFIYKDLKYTILITNLLRMKEYVQKAKILCLLCLTITLLVSLALTTTHSGLANAQQNSTFMQPQAAESMATNATNIVLVHGGWADGSGWSKEISILHEAGHQVIAVQLPLHSLSDDVATVKRAVEHIGGPTILVGHSYGGAVITNAAYNNPNVTGLVYIAAFAPDEGQSLSSFVDPAKFPKDLFITDSGGFIYLNPKIFRENFAQDVDPTEADIMAAAQKPFHQSNFVAKSGPPAWKQLPTWYQISDDDHMIPPDVQHTFAQRMNATTLSLNASHASYVSHPNEIAEFILNATKGR